VAFPTFPTVGIKALSERFYGAGTAKYDQIPCLARPCHHRKSPVAGCNAGDDKRH
jgi:hypothetical protein